MRTLFPSESCKARKQNAVNPQSWLQAERITSSKFSSKYPSPVEPLIRVPDPPIVQFFKPVDYVEILAQIHEELESCPPEERSNLYLLQYHVFKGLGEVKLIRRSLRATWFKATNVYEKLIFGAWLKYERQGAEIISDLLKSCGKHATEFGIIDVASELHTNENLSSRGIDKLKNSHISRVVSFQIGDERIVCDRRKIAALSIPFHAMLYECFTESSCEDIDMSENNISPSSMRLISDFSITGILNEAPSLLLLEVLAFANKFCCESLKTACDRKLASLVCSRQDTVELMEYALEQNSPVLGASCLQVFLHELPDSLNDSQVFELLSNANKQQRSKMVALALFSFNSLLSEVAINGDPRLDKAALLSNQLAECAETSRQKMIAYHQLA